MQKKSSITLLITLMLFALCTIEVSNASTTSSSTIIRLIKQPAPINKPVDDADSDGKRAPSRPISCIISEYDGITLEGFDEELLSYEIWINSDILVNSFTSENEFINYLFSHPGEYQIQLKSENYILIGYIVIN